jgi:hypothetical protein
MAELQKWERKLEPAGITLGAWIAVVESAGRELAAKPSDPVARAIRLSCDAALPGLKTFNAVRNTYAHGGKPRLRADQEMAAGDLGTGLSAILDAVEPLTRMKLGVVRECEARGNTWQVDVDIMAGAAEPFPAQRLRSARHYDKDEVVAFHGNNLASGVALTPFCAWTKCPECGREELFYLHQRRRKRNSYFRFSTGHKRIVRGELVQRARQPAVALGMEPLGSVRAAASSGWRASWAMLASRPRRMAARIVDLAMVGVVHSSPGS